MAPRIVVVGSLNMDLVVRAPRHPRPGETLTGSSFLAVPGGKGANQAVAAARMGGDVTMIGRVGGDPFGDRLVETLRAAGVDTSAIGRALEPTGVALITVSERGENTIVIVPGANGAMTPEAIESASDRIANADAVLLQLEVPIAAVSEASALAARRGVPVFLSPAPAQPLPLTLLRQVSYLIPNEHEAALLADLEDASEGGVDMAVKRLRDLGARAVIVTLGASGALVSTGVTHEAVPSFPVDAIDSTAAGDAFVGAFAVATCEGHSLIEAVRWGCAAGALACTALGAQPSLPHRPAVERLLRGP